MPILTYKRAWGIYSGQLWTQLKMRSFINLEGWKNRYWSKQWQTIYLKELKREIMSWKIDVLNDLKCRGFWNKV